MVKNILKQHEILKTIVEIIVLGIFAWTFIQVRDIPEIYISRAEANQIITVLKTDINRTFVPIREQVQQIYKHLLAE